jgi:hypothetical protein
VTSSSSAKREIDDRFVHRFLGFSQLIFGHAIALNLRKSVKSVDDLVVVLLRSGGVERDGVQSAK